MTDQTRWWLVGTGAFMAIGAFLPWVEAGILSLAGTRGDGVFLLIGGAIIAIIGLAKKATALTGVAVIVIAAFCLWVVYTVFSNTADLVTDPDAILSAGPGTGLFVSGFASLMALIAGFKTFGERNNAEVAGAPQVASASEPPPASPRDDLPRPPAEPPPTE